MVERRAVEQSYQLSDESTVAQLARVYVACMMDLRSSNRIGADIEPTKLMLQELL
jgi:hypothetical protein